MAQRDDHAILEVIFDQRVVATAFRVHGKSLTVLGKSCSEFVVGVEIDLHVEGLARVDLLSGAVLTGLLTNLEARTALVAVPVVAFIGRGIALVWSSMPSISVCLLDVKLGAEVTTALVGVAIVVFSLGRVNLTILVLSWHAYQVEGRVAATAGLG